MRIATMKPSLSTVALTSSRSKLIFGALATAAALWLPAPGRATDFVRGDLNGDGVVSVADAYYFLNWLHRDGPPPSCLLTADVTDDGVIRDGGPGVILSFMSERSHRQIPPPFPRPGADPTPNEDQSLDCESYGGGAPLDDPAAELHVLDAVTSGGDEDEVVLTLALSTSREIAGYSGTIYFADSALASHSQSDIRGTVGNPQLTDLTGTINLGYWEEPEGLERHDGFLVYGVWNNRLEFTFLTQRHGRRRNEERVPDRIPPSEDLLVAEIRICLDRGTTAGDYRMILEEGELVDAETARRIVPRLGSGILTVQSDLAEGRGCHKRVPLTCDVRPEEVHAVYELRGGLSARGGSISLPMTIRANAQHNGFAFSIDFDEEVLQATAVEPVWTLDKREEYDFQVFQWNNRNDTPGNAGVDEGFLVGAVVYSLSGPDRFPPAHEDVEVLRFHFDILEDSEADVTEVRFLDGAPVRQRGALVPVPNHIGLCGGTVTPEAAGSFVFVNGVIAVIDDIAVFIRGDSNGDEEVDLSDVQTTLSFLFLGAENPHCFDAADSNDDGIVDISDPVRTLQFLFLGGAALPSPFPEPGEDPPPQDSLGCLYRS